MMVLSRDVVSALSEAGVPSALTTRSPTLSPTNGGFDSFTFCCHVFAIGSYVIVVDPGPL